jgi:hypothetical protein
MQIILGIKNPNYLLLTGLLSRGILHVVARPCRLTFCRGYLHQVDDSIDVLNDCSMLR